MERLSPDFWHDVVCSIGDLYGRMDKLDLRSREIASISALIVMGNALPQLKVHIKAGLHVGLTQTEIKEIIMQMRAYIGYPASINAMMVADEVFSEINDHAV